MTLAEQVETEIRNRRLLRKKQNLLVAVSGGMDSMALLQLLKQLAPIWSWKLAVGHVDHQLRGRSSTADANLVKRECAKMALDCLTVRVDVRKHAKDQGVSIEMAARELRHRQLVRLARELGSHTIVLAHHANDQVEQFFLRMLRGAGVEGLAGMSWKAASPFDSKYTLVRPLLGVSREALSAYVSDRKILYREDASNRSLEVPRNRIRHELIPCLTERYQPRLIEVITRQTELLAAESEHLKEEARRWIQSDSREPFASLTQALQRRCILIQLHDADLSADFDLVEWLRNNPGKPISVAPDVTASRTDSGEVKVVKMPGVAEFNSSQLKLDLTDKRGHTTFAGRSLDWSRARSSIRPKRQFQTEWFDADRIGTSVLLRHWREGDRFQPIGMTHSVKLQDWFTNLKIPRDRRRELLVAETRGGQIWWVEGLRIGERFKVTSETRWRLRWAWR